MKIKMNEQMKQILESIAAIIGLLAILAVILGYPIMLLWNWLMPEIFGLREITFWQAIGINILCHLLFKDSINVVKENKEEK
jgi:uncharacterized membrane protein